MDVLKLRKSVDLIESLLRKGYDLKTIKRDHPVSDEVVSIARARIKNARENKIEQSFIFTEDDLRFCTNQVVANYRAKRLACTTIVDIGCGIGIQALAFAKTCKKVIAIDIDKGRIERAKLNANIAGARNIEFIQADALKVLSSLKEADIIFWDPERPPSESKRLIQSFSPSFDAVMQESERLTRSVAIELPPRLSPEEIPGNPELEYIVLDHETNRLTAYFGALKQVERSVLSLPQEERLSTADAQEVLEESKDIQKYLAEIDEAIIAADLLGTLSPRNPKAFLLKIENKQYLSSAHKIEDPFLKVYKVQKITKQAQLAHDLKIAQCARVILHGKIPEKAYASWRKRLQEATKGNQTCHLFVVGDELAITIKQ